MAYEFILLSDEIREKMFDYLKPAYKRKYDLDVASINWTTGIYDKESGIFLTKIYFVSDGIARCGIHYHSYIVITDSGNVFTVTNNDEFEKGTYDFRIPKQYVTLIEKVKEGIDYYEDNNYKCKRTLNDDIKRKLDEINNIMDDRCHRNFLVNCEEDAHKLFIHVDCNIHTILDIYNKKTINDFKKFATDNKVMCWKSNRYLQLLNKVRSADITNQERCQSFNKACSFIWNGVIDTYDKQFFETVKYMYDTCIMSAGNESSLERYIIAYADKYSDKIKNIIPMIEFVYAHTEKRYLKGAIENVKKLYDEEIKMSINFQFDYLSKYPEKKDKLKNMHLLAYDGLNIPLERIDDRLYFDAPLIDVNNDVYVIPFSRWPFILNRAHEKSRQDILREKFNTRDKICEYYFLLNGKYSPKSLYVFTEEHGFQDGWYLKVVGVIEYDSFTWQEEPIIKPMLSQAFHFMHQHEPEFQYSCSDDLFKIHTSYDVEVKLKETYPELDKYSLENISKVISYATTHSTMNLNEISQITSIAPEDVRTILGATFIMWNH